MTIKTDYVVKIQCAVSMECIVYLVPFFPKLYVSTPLFPTFEN